MKNTVSMDFKVIHGTKEDNKECLFFKSEVSVSQETNLRIQRHEKQMTYQRDIICDPSFQLNLFRMVLLNTISSH